MASWFVYECSLCNQRRLCSRLAIRGADFNICKACVASARRFTRGYDGVDGDLATVTWALQRVGVLRKRDGDWVPAWAEEGTADG